MKSRSGGACGGVWWGGKHPVGIARLSPCPLAEKEQGGGADVDEQDIVERIRLKLRWVRGIPTAVGSGWCSMLHKLHAVMHA